MRGRLSLFALAALLMPAQQVPLGQIIDDVVCAKDASQHYALYLPPNYTPDRQWPLILAFDPGGRGKCPLEHYLAAAEKYGYIVAGSNVSRNGSWSVSMGAAQAMGADVTARFSIDEKRIYTAGMSGGARVAMGLAMGSPKVIAGVIASSAGYPDSKPRKTVPFLVFGTAGNEDFNWLEMRSLDHALTSPHHLAVFPGGHVWLPSDLAVEAVEWLNLQAMREGRMPRNQKWIDSLFAARQDKANAIADEWERCQRLETLAADFKDLHDIGVVTATAAALRKTKPVKELQKKDQSEEFQERRLLGDILDWEQGLQVPEKRSESLARLIDIWKRMDTQAKSEEDTAARRIARRVSRGLAMGASDRTKDPEYLSLLSKYRPARMGQR